MTAMHEVTLSCGCDLLTTRPAARSVKCVEHGPGQSIRYVEPAGRRRP